MPCVFPLCVAYVPLVSPLLPRNAARSLRSFVTTLLYPLLLSSDVTSLVASPSSLSFSASQILYYAGFSFAFPWTRCKSVQFSFFSSVSLRSLRHNLLADLFSRHCDVDLSAALLWLVCLTSRSVHFIFDIYRLSIFTPLSRLLRAHFHRSNYSRNIPHVFLPLFLLSLSSTIFLSMLSFRNFLLAHTLHPRSAVRL